MTRAGGPQFQRQILDRCDLAGLARVEAIGRDPPQARLRFVDLVKGAPQAVQGLASDEALVARQGGLRFAADGSRVSVGWSDWWAYPEGATVMTHLVWNEAKGVYETCEGAVAIVTEEMAA